MADVAPPWLWHECERFEQQQGSRRADARVAASGLGVLGAGWGQKAGDYALYHVELSARMVNAVLHLRYARAGAGEAALDVFVDAHRIRTSPTLRLPQTEGAGDDPGQWRFVSCSIGTLDAGRHTVRLVLAEDGGDVHLDGFYLASGAALPRGISDPVAFWEETEAHSNRLIFEIRRRVAREIQLPSPPALPRAAPRGADVTTLLAESSRAMAPGLQEALALKPSPYLVKAHDVGVPTDFNTDIPWHLLEKEKDERFDIPHFGKLGLVNTNSDVNWLIGLGVGDGPVSFDPTRRCVDHLINLIVQEVTIGDLRGHVLFLPITSDTALAVVALTNASTLPRTVHVESVCTKPPVELVPFDRYGYGVSTTTGKLQWVGYNEPNGALVSSYDEWKRRALQPVGVLICTMVGSEKPATHRTSLAGGLPGGTGVEEAVLRFRVDLPPETRRTLLISLNLHRYGAEQFETPMEMVLYPEETESQALAYSIGAAVEALGVDWPQLVRKSFKWYERVPSVQLPPESWTTGFYCALELPRANTWSAQGKLPQPWYTLCRPHGNEPYGWWSYGMHGHEHLSTLVVNITEPALSQSFLRGHFQNQRPDGRMPYGVNRRGVSAHSGDLATCPFLMWEAWNAYLWSGDRAFLEEAYRAGRRWIAWWCSPARTRPGVPLQHWKDYLETVRDDADLATWMATDKAEFQEALDLNCYLLNEQRALAAMAQELGRDDEAAQRQADAEKRLVAMRQLLWHGEDSVYYGRDLVEDRWARVMDVSTFFPLWCGLATADQAPRLVALLHDPEAFGTDYPVATLAVRHMPAHLRGQWHWRGANWVEMTWLVILGLKQYGYHDEAARLAEINCRMAFDTLNKTGHLREYYNSLTGAPTDLTDYIWASMPGIMITDAIFGVRPTARGLEVLPALPAGWSSIAMENLQVRISRLSVHVRRDAKSTHTTVMVNGSPKPTLQGRGVFIPWDRLPTQCIVDIVQPDRIPQHPVARHLSEEL